MTIAEVDETLASLPRDLHETYSRVLLDMDCAKRSLACKILVWLFSKPRHAEALRLHELASMLSEDENHHFAKSNEPSIMDVVELCQILTVHTSGFRTSHESVDAKLRPHHKLDFAHSSVRDWLQYIQHQDDSPIPELCRSHERLAETTLYYLEWWTHNRCQNHIQLLGYSARYCLHHARYGASAQVMELAMNLLDADRESFRAWPKLHHKETILQNLDNQGTGSFPSSESPIYYASLYQLHWAVKRLISANHTVNASGGLYGYPLHAACLNLYLDENPPYADALETIRTLLAAGADVNLIGGIYGTALQTIGVASSRRQHDVSNFVELLLKAGADVNLVGGLYGTALQAASLSDLRLDGAVSMLIAAGADVNLSGGLYGTPLQAASFRGSKQIVQQLLAAGADVNSVDVFGDGFNATHPVYVQDTVGLANAIWTFHEVWLHEGDCTVPLQSASFRGSLEIVELLLAAGADVNLIGAKFGTALQASCYRESGRMVNLLLAAGANTNSIGGEYGTALQAAAFWDSPEIVELLLAAGADVNIIGGKYGTALQAAATIGTLVVMNILIAAGANVNIEAGIYGCALSAAVALKEKRKVAACRRDYNKPREVQVINAVRMLLDAGANVNRSGERHSYALECALDENWFDVAALLRERGAKTKKEVDYRRGLGLDILIILMTAGTTRRAWISRRVEGFGTVWIKRPVTLKASRDRLFHIVWRPHIKSFGSRIIVLRRDYPDWQCHDAHTLRRPLP